MEETSLAPPEWAAVILFTAVTGCMAGLAYFSPFPERPTSVGQPFYIAPQEIAIRVSGAVDQPGTYWIAKGSTVGELLKRLTLSEEADLSRLDLDKPLRKGQRLKIPAKKNKRKSLSSTRLKGQ